MGVPSVLSYTMYVHVQVMLVDCSAVYIYMSEVCLYIVVDVHVHIQEIRQNISLCYTCTCTMYVMLT